MRSFLKVCAAALVLTCGVALTERANAMPLAPLAPATEAAGLVEQVQYGCRPVWRCGPWGCGWRRVCWGAPYYRPYGFRPYYGYGYGYGYGYRPWGYGPWGYRRYW